MTQHNLFAFSIIFAKQRTPPEFPQEFFLLDSQVIVPKRWKGCWNLQDVWQECYIGLDYLSGSQSDFEEQGGEQNKGGDRWQNNAMGAKTLNHYH